MFGCDHGCATPPLTGPDTGAISLPCIAMLPPAFIDYVLSRGLADGVLLAGCRENACYHRLGVEWTEARLAGTRDPYLRDRVPRDRLAVSWVSATDERRLQKTLTEFQARLVALNRESDKCPVAAAAGGGDD